MNVNKEKKIQGKFQAIESFAIRKRDEYYLIGEMLEGIAKENWFINIPLNKSLNLTVRITGIEEIEFSDESKKYTLLIVSGDQNDLNLLLGLNVGNEYLNITLEGED